MDSRPLVDAYAQSSPRSELLSTATLRVRQPRLTTHGRQCSSAAIRRPTRSILSTAVAASLFATHGEHLRDLLLTWVKDKKAAHWIVSTTTATTNLATVAGRHQSSRRTTEGQEDGRLSQS